jgi:hypothetical protein
MGMSGGKSADHRFATDLQRPRRLPILNDVYHVGQRPKLGCDASGHRRGNPQALMDTNDRNPALWPVTLKLTHYLAVD